MYGFEMPYEDIARYTVPGFFYGYQLSLIIRQLVGCFRKVRFTFFQRIDTLVGDGKQRGVLLTVLKDERTFAESLTRN